MTPEQLEANAKRLAELEATAAEREARLAQVIGYRACDLTDGSLICRKPAGHDGPHAYC